MLWLLCAGTLVFDRQSAEVDSLRSLTPHDLVAFFEEVLGLNGRGRRKLMVLIRGRNELQQQQQNGATAAEGNGHPDAQSGDEVCASGDVQALAPSADKQQQTCPPDIASNSISKQLDSSSNSSSELYSYAAAAVPAGEPFVLVRDINAFKKGCEVYPAAGEQIRRSHGINSGTGTAGSTQTGEAAAAANTDEVVAKL